MTKKKTKSRRRDRNFVAIPFANSLALSTLADEAVISAELMAAFGEDIFLISADFIFSLRGNAGGEMPIVVGIAHGDLSTTEVSEALSAEVTDPDDIIAKERARRPVRRIGTFAQGALTDQTLNNGVPIRQRILFSVGDGHTLDFWAANRSGAALTTGAIIEVQGTLFGRWQR